MSFRTLAKPLDKILIDNSPTILTFFGVLGTGVSVYWTGKATFKAAEVLREAEENPEEPSLPLDKKEKIKRVWTLYIPPISIAVLTMGSIIMSNRISAKRCAALATAYTLADKAHSEYADKVKETFGINKEQKVRDDIAQDGVTNSPPDYIYRTGDGDSLCKDDLSGRYFYSSMESIKEAVNHINHLILKHGSVSLNDFYGWLNLDQIPWGEEFGWNGDRLMEPRFSSTLTPDKRPCLVLGYAVQPARSFDKAH